MSNKKLLFIVVSSLLSFVSIGLIIGTFFIQNEITKIYLVISALAILIVQKVVEFIKIKETRKASSIILVVLIAMLAYYIKIKF